MMRNDASESYTDRSPLRSHSPIENRFLLKALLVAAAFLFPAMAKGQSISIYPPVLYSGLNFITIEASAGLSSVTGYMGGRWRSLLTGASAPYVKIVSGPTFVQCSRRVTMVVQLLTNRTVGFQLRVADCRGNIKYFDFEESEDWNVYREDFGTVIQGSTACRTFAVDANNVGAYIDSVASVSPDFKIRYTSRRPPVRLDHGSYRYDVCFTAKRTGRIKMPILVYLRRKYPAGGQNNFIVADTAYVNVIPPPVIAGTTPPRTPKPRPRQRVLIAQPKPIIIAPPKPVDTPKVIPKVELAAIRTIPSTPLPPAIATLAPRQDLAEVLIDEEITDPTPHRVILLPTARPVDSGRVFVSNYDLAGWLAGYGLNDRTTLLVGGLYIPKFINQNVVATAGGRYEFYREGMIRAAAGAQVNYARSETSSILLLSPYAVASVGDDDQRATLAFGYTWRRHTPDNEQPFEKQALVLSGGGDYRIGRHWKVAAEAHLLQGANYQPLGITLRYFTKNFAIDAGAGIDLGFAGEAREFTIAPIVTATWVW